MNKNCNMCENKKLLIPEHELYTVVEERNAYYSLLSNIIVLFKHEDKLKKHHRPYLHVRAELDKMCDKALKCIEEMGTQREDLELHVTDAVCEDCVCENDSSDEEVDTTVSVPDSAQIATWVDDLTTLVEYLETQTGFIKLLKAGIKIDEQIAEFESKVDMNLLMMTERWNRYMIDTYSELVYESE